MNNPVKHVVIHQSGKVGSSTLLAALTAARPELTAVKPHFLSAYYAEYFRTIVSHPNCPSGLRNVLQQQLSLSGRAHALLQNSPPEQCCIIGGVRDPLSFAVSAFFQNLSVFLPDLGFKPARHDAELSRTIECFHKLFAYCSGDSLAEPIPLYARWVLGGAGVNWYADDYGPTYGIDVTALPPMDSPAVSFGHAGRRHVIYRFEAFPACLDEVLRDLGLPPIGLHRKNVSKNKPYAALYESFLTQFRPTPAMWGFYYESPFFRHFYPDATPAYPRRSCGAQSPADRSRRVSGRKDEPPTARKEPAEVRREVFVPHAGWLSFSSDDRVAHNLEEGWFEALEQAFVWQYARPGDVFIDCGAHVGLFTLVAAAATDGSGPILAVEPLAQNVDLLRQNVAANGLRNVEVVEAAAGRQIGRAAIYGGAEGMSAWSTLFPPREGSSHFPVGVRERPQDVGLVTLDSLVRSRKISRVAFVKIDVEGAEAEVLAGFDKTLASRSVGVLMLEFTDENLRRAGLDTKALLDAIAARGLTCCRFCADSRQLVPVDYEGPIAYENLFATFDVDRVNRRLRNAAPRPMRIATSLVNQWRLHRRTATLGGELREARRHRRQAEGQLKEVDQLRRRAERRLQVSEEKLDRSKTRLKQTQRNLAAARARLPSAQLLQKTRGCLKVVERQCDEAQRRLDSATRELREADDRHIHDCRRASQAEEALSRLQLIGERLRSSETWRWLQRIFPSVRKMCDAVADAINKPCQTSESSVRMPPKVAPLDSEGTPESDAMEKEMIVRIPETAERDGREQTRRKAA